jgi:hypothetical protein
VRRRRPRFGGRLLFTHRTREELVDFARLQGHPRDELVKIIENLGEPRVAVRSQLPYS